MPLNIPNTLTWARIALIPIFVGVFYLPDGVLSGTHKNLVSTAIFIVAAVTDWFDGYLARSLGQTSAFGAFLDPVADKALLVSVYVTLGATGFLPSWLVILVVFRDVLIVGGVLTLYVLGQEPAIRPLFVSKANTAMQILLAAAVLLHAAYGVPAAGVVTVLLWITAGTTFASGAAYVARWVRGGGASG